MLLAKIPLTHYVVAYLYRTSPTAPTYDAVARLTPQAYEDYPDLEEVWELSSCTREMWDDPSARNMVATLSMTVKSKIYKANLRGRVFYMEFPYDVFLHTFYNCYASRPEGLPSELWRGITRKLLCATLRFLVEEGVIRPTDVMALEADGPGPFSTSVDEHDRRPLVEYYRKVFGFEPIIPLRLLEEPDTPEVIYRHVPMYGIVRGLLVKCGE